MRSVVFGFALAFVAAGCGPLAQPALGRVDALPPQPSPDMRDQRNRLDVYYHLNAPASVSSRIVSADAGQWPIASDSPRPVAGDYVLEFDGTVAGPGLSERRVLPDGDYQVVLEVDSGGQHQQAQVPLHVRDADSRIPDIADLALLPDRISPNFDARADITHVTYRLAKDAYVAPYLDTTSETGQSRRVWMGEEIKAQAGGSFTAGQTIFDLKKDGVGYSTSGGKIDDIKAKLDDYKQKIIAGTITVPTKP